MRAWLPVLLMLCPGCGPADEPAPMQTGQARTELQGAASAQLRIDMPGGLLELSGGARDLVEAHFRFDTERMRPVLRRTTEDDRALIEVAAPGYGDGVGRTRNEWALELLDSCPFDLKLAMRAGRARLELAGLAVRSLDLNLGGGELLVDLSGATLSGDLSGHLELGHGKLLLELPGGVGLRVRAWKSVGSLVVTGLTEDPHQPESWVNADFGTAEHSIDLTARVGWGDLEIVVSE